ncbi:Uncharacterised protein [uncultured archaeon]|nr:Uncharacterised protein [uncultured archaeon]
MSDLGDLQSSDKDLRREASRIIAERKERGLEGLVGGLQAVIINVEPEKQQQSALELMRYSGLDFREAFLGRGSSTIVLRVPGDHKFHSADFLIRSRMDGKNPFKDINRAPKSGNLPNTRLETFVFESHDIEKYFSIQKEAGVKFLGGIQDAGDYYFLETDPSLWTGNSLGFIQWKGKQRSYITPSSERLEDRPEKPDREHLKNIRYLDHAATRVKAQDRDNAILEFMQLTNYNFDFAIYVRSLNSITSVARLNPSDFAMVFTSGIAPYASDEASGPTEKFIRNYGTRVHHIAFQTEQIENTCQSLASDGLKFLLDLVGSPEEGLKQIFTEPSKNTLLVTEYIHRYGEFDGFFARSNVTLLTAATGKQ